MRVRGWSSIGPAQVIAETTVEDNRQQRVEEIARITIPDADLADTVAILLSRCYQQNIMSDTLKQAIGFAQECIDARS